MGFRTLNAVDVADGTVQLVDSDQGHQHLANSNIVLVPQPSKDPADPLRWPQWRKMLAFGTVCMFCFFSIWIVDVPVGGFINIAQQFGLGLNEVSGLLIWPVLTLGLGNFFWVPLALKYGKRPIFLISSLITFLSQIWAAEARSFNSLLAASIVGAFASSSGETLAPAMVNDLFFLHERGQKMGYYIIAISWGSTVGPLCGGFMMQHLGWRWSKWICAILVGILFLMIVLAVPETKFHRQQDYIASSSTNEPKDAVNEGLRQVNSSSESSGLDTTNAAAGKTYLDSLKPWSCNDKDTSLLSNFLRPFPLALYPACAFALLSFSISLAPLVVFSTVSSFVFQAPPYNFSASIVGLIGVPGLIGNLIGGIVGGVMTDIWAKRQAKRNDGVFEPESRLALLVFIVPTVFTGLLMVGFGCQYHSHWAVIYVGFGFMSVGLTGVSNIVMTYCMDSYFVVAAECLLLVNGAKNVIAFGFSYAAIPWVQAQGYAKCFAGLAGIFLATLILGVPLMIYGARIRHHTASKWPLISW